MNPDFAIPIAFPRTSKDVSLNHISGCEYWILDRTNGNSNVDVSLTWDTRSCGVTNLGNLRVARWDGTSWRDHGNGGTTGTTLTGSITTNGVVTNFSPFTLASNSFENPLPVELISFTASLKQEVVELIWQTESEIQNAKFELEKSQDAIDWSTLSIHKGAGNSNRKLTYSTIDLNPLDGTNYYRLKQIDFDGSYTFSNVISIDYFKEDIKFYPNPFVNQFSVEGLDKTDRIQVFTVDGKLVHESSNRIVNTTSWIAGIYFLVIKSENEEIRMTKKIIK